MLMPFLLTLLAGLSTGIGSFITLFVKGLKPGPLQFSLGLSAGVMIYISFVELLPQAVEIVGFLPAHAAFFIGIAVIMIIDFFVPHDYIEERAAGSEQEKKLMSTGKFTALGIAIHNIPEGLAVFMSAMVDMRLGVALAIAIALHNIPEGVAVAMPIYYATGNRAKAFWYSLLSGLAEPLGAIAGIIILRPFLNEFTLAACFAFAAGIMVFISFDELLPLSYKYKGEHISISGVLSGILLMAVSLYFLNAA